MNLSSAVKSTPEEHDRQQMERKQIAQRQCVCEEREEKRKEEKEKVNSVTVTLASCQRNQMHEKTKQEVGV